MRATCQGPQRRANEHVRFPLKCVLAEVTLTAAADEPSNLGRVTNRVISHIQPPERGPSSSGDKQKQRPPGVPHPLRLCRLHQRLLWFMRKRTGRGGFTEQRWPAPSPTFCVLRLQLQTPRWQGELSWGGSAAACLGKRGPGLQTTAASATAALRPPGTYFSLLGPRGTLMLSCPQKRQPSSLQGWWLALCPGPLGDGQVQMWLLVRQQPPNYRRTICTQTHAS